MNIVQAAGGLFTQCAPPGPWGGCVTTAGLAGTGFANGVGGATGWLDIAGNVTPGEDMTIRFAIWDTGDHSWDSVVLVDNWTWSVQGTDTGVTPG